MLFRSPADEIAKRLESALYFIGSRWPDAPHTYNEAAAFDPVEGVDPCVTGGNCTIEFTSKAGRKGPVGIIHFDSHTDTYGDSAGVHCHAGNGFRIGNEEGLIDASRYVLVGLNGPMVHPNMDDYSKEAGYRLLSLSEIEDIGIAAAAQEIRKVVGDGPVYVTVDLDVLTLSDAPAVADPEAGGLTMREMQKILRSLRGMDVVGGDVVCFVPHLDPSQITALHISAIMHEIVTVMAEGVASKR